jgi:hypothetical protein
VFHKGVGQKFKGAEVMDFRIGTGHLGSLAAPLYTYKEFGEQEFGVTARWVSRKKLLDDVAANLAARNEPNVTFILKNALTCYPGQIDMRPAKPPDSQQKQYAFDEMGKIMRAYNISGTNPYS